MSRKCWDSDKECSYATRAFSSVDPSYSLGDGTIEISLGSRDGRFERVLPDGGDWACVDGALGEVGSEARAEAVARSVGSIMKHLFKKVLHLSEKCSGGAGGVEDVATWNRAAKLLRNSGQGGLPVPISMTVAPTLQPSSEMASA